MLPASSVRTYITGMTVAPRLQVAIATGLLCIALPLALHAAPGGAWPLERLPRSGPNVRAPAVRSDTVAKVEKGKAEKGVQNPRKRSLKGKQPSTGTTPDPRQFVPDQPWETEFFVENDLTTPPQRGLIVLASVRR